MKCVLLGYQMQKIESSKGLLVDDLEPTSTKLHVSIVNIFIFNMFIV